MPLKSQVFTVSGTFNVPAGVSSVIIAQMVAAGSGGTGSPNNSVGQGAGAAGELMQNIFLPVTPGGFLAVTVGVGGIGGINGINNARGTSGTLSAVGPFTCLPGLAPQQGQTLGTGGGGGDGGGEIGDRPSDHYIQSGNSLPRNGFFGTKKAPCCFSGGEGAGGFSGPTQTLSGAASGGHLAVFGGTPNGVFAGGGGGASTVFGFGGRGGDGYLSGTSSAADAYGCGGGGAGARSTGAVANGGDGSGGYVVICWFGP